MDNEERASLLCDKYKFDFSSKYHAEIQLLLKKEIEDFQEGSSEYIRFLCGYLFCIGKIEDYELIKEAKYSISFDVQCMVDGEWLDRLKLGDKTDDTIPDREELIEYFVSYYRDGGYL